MLISRFYPLPDRTGNPNFVAAPDSASDWREDLFRIDQMFTQNVIATIRYAYDYWGENQGIMEPSSFAFPTGPGFFAKPGYNIIGRLTWTATPTTVNAFTFGYSFNQQIQNPVGDAASRNGLNIPKIFPANFYNAIPNISLSGFGGIGIGSPNRTTNPVYEWKDDLSHIAGSHSLKFGFDFLRIQKFLRTLTNEEGTFTFNGQYTGNAVADFLLGDAFTYAESSAAPNSYLFSNTYEMYAQDDWKISPHLTVNLGLRWGIFCSAPDGYEKYGNISNFSPTLYNPAKAPVMLADGEIQPGTGNLLNGIYTPANMQGLSAPRSMRDTHYDMPGPRIGFAWSLGNSARTVIRGGYGIFYSWDNTNQESLRANPPFTNSASVSNALLSNPAGGLSRLFPAMLPAKFASDAGRHLAHGQQLAAQFLDLAPHRRRCRAESVTARGPRS
jgi:hypothetical protein